MSSSTSRRIATRPGQTLCLFVLLAASTAVVLLSAPVGSGASAVGTTPPKLTVVFQPPSAPSVAAVAASEPHDHLPSVDGSSDQPTTAPGVWRVARLALVAFVIVPVAWQAFSIVLRPGRRDRSPRRT